MEQSALQIGEVSNRAGVSIDTVRYYERLKLLPPAARSTGGFRIFTSEAIERIKFIKHAQDMGFTLDEIKQLFSVGEGESQCRAVHAFLLEKLSELETKIEQMRSFRKVLNRHLAECEKELEARGKEAACPVLVTIETVKK